MKIRYLALPIGMAVVAGALLVVIRPGASGQSEVEEHKAGCSYSTDLGWVTFRDGRVIDEGGGGRSIEDCNPDTQWRPSWDTGQ
jgi:hypothetical protein